MATSHLSVPSRHPQQGLQALWARRSPVYLAVILGHLLLLPSQVNMTFAGSVLPPYRIFLIAMMAATVSRFVSQRIKMAWPDYAILAVTGWISLAMFLTSSQEEAFTATVANITDVAMAYFFARMTITNVREFRMFLILMLPILVFVALTMVIESITHRLVIQEAFSQLTGRRIQYGSSPRFGLMRAVGSFPHPILAGIFFTSFLPLYFLSGFKVWPRTLGSFAAFCAFFTVSSASLLGLVATFLVLLYSWITKRITNATWSLFFFGLGLIIFVAELATKSGTFALFVRFASFNSLSAYNRVLIWRYGSMNVAENPWFGLGYADWKRPVWMGDSMDNYWLVLAVRFGMPASILVGLATLLAVLMLMRKSMRSAPSEADFERGVIISVCIFALGMMSVSLWLSAQVWFFALLGMTVSLAQAKTAISSQP